MSYLSGIAPPLWGHQSFDISRFNITWDQSTKFAFSWSFSKIHCISAFLITAWHHFGWLLHSCWVGIWREIGGLVNFFFFFDEEKKSWPLTLRNPALSCWGFGVLKKAGDRAGVLSAWLSVDWPAGGCVWACLWGREIISKWGICY